MTVTGFKQERLVDITQVDCDVIHLFDISGRPFHLGTIVI